MPFSQGDQNNTVEVMETTELLTNEKDMTDILRDNILIAEFMGLKQQPERGVLYEEHEKKVYFATSLQYHISYDWLMPVVEKLEHLKGVTIIIDGNHTTIKYFDKQICRQWDEQKIKSIYTAIVKFLIE